MTRIHANNFITSLNGSISSGATEIILTSVTGFPSIGGGVTCNVTLANGADIEIVTATARSSFTLTVTRAAEGTVAKAFASGSTVSIRPTADSVDRKADLAAPAFTGAVTSASDITVNGLTMGKGLASVATNSAFGVSALATITTGLQNSSFGYLALQMATTGSYNNAVGATCLRNLTTGQFNNGQGINCLNALTTGQENTGLGTSTLYALTTGSYNTCVGTATGTSEASGGVNLTTGTYNTCIGYEAATNSAAAIGTLALGTFAIADIATGSGSGDIGPGVAIGSTAHKVGFAGDGSIIQTAGSSVGYWRVKLNGTYYKFLMLADS